MEEAYKYLSRGQFQDALKHFSSVLDRQPDNDNASAGYRISRFWLNRMNLLKSDNPAESRVEEFIFEWQKFENYAQEYNMNQSASYNALLRYIHRLLTFRLPYLSRELHNRDVSIDSVIKMGELFIQLEDWDSAIQALEAARSVRKEDATLLAYLGEAYYQARQEHKGLVMFREAFFVDAQSIPLDRLQSRPIREALDEMGEAGIQQEDLAEWLPIFGTLLGILNVKRNLDQNQLHELYENTIKLEEAYRNNSAHSMILPRLLNHYLWLLDYFLFQEDDKKARDEIVSRVHSLDPRVHELLLSAYNL